MGLFNKKVKINNDRSIIDKIQFELINNSNIDEERIVLADVKFPYNDKLETIDLIMITNKGVFTFMPLTIIGEYVGGQFETMWNISGVKFRNPIETISKSSLKLKEFLNIESKNVIPYIILNNQSIIRDIPMCSKKYRIVKENDLYYFLGIHTDILPNVFTDKEVNAIKRKLNKSNIIKELYNS